MNFKYTEETLKESAIKYNTKVSFKKNEPLHYNAIVKRKLLNKLCSHMLPSGNLFKRVVYEFTFSDNSKYVGITLDFNRRLSEHKEKLFKGKTLIHTSVSDFMELDKALDLESTLVIKYIAEGIVLHNKRNMRSAGSSTLIWNKDKCIEEAKKYKTRIDWHNKSPNSYDSARRHKWFIDCTRHMERSKTGKRKIKCLNTGFIFNSLSEAAAYYKTSSSNLRVCLRLNKKYKNIKLEYYE